MSKKIGFDFYRADTDRYQDIRIKRLKRNFGCNGLALYDYLLCEIYRGKGCFMAWNAGMAFDTADYLGLEETAVEDMVSYCAEVGLFSKELLEINDVLSSAAIQTRYISMCEVAKRQQVQIPEHLNLVPELTAKFLEKRAKIHQLNPIVEYSKEENTKEESCGLPNDASPEPALPEVTPEPYQRDEALEKEVLTFWGFNQIANPDKVKTIFYFCQALHLTGRLEYFRTQFSAYKRFIEPRYKCALRNFLGTPEQRFDDGAWNRENWEQKLAEQQRARGQPVQNHGNYPMN